MSRNGSGTYNLPAGNPVVTGTTITSSWANTTLNDIATALTGSVASDGQTPMSGSLNMATNRIINVGTPSSSTDATTKDYVDTAIATQASTDAGLYLAKASNLSDVASASTSRTNLGLGSIATQSASSVSITGGTITGITDLAIADGGTGASTAADARTNLGLGTLATQSSVTRANMYTGAVLQVVQAVKTDAFSSSSGSFTDVTGLSASITPTSSSNKVMVTVSIYVSAADNCANTLRLVRGSTEIAGTAGTNGGFASFGNSSFVRESMTCVSLTYIDSPSTTSSTTYKIQGLTSGTFNINQSNYAGVLSGRIATSSITLTEIVG